MTPKQQRFIEEYLVDLNATQAAKRSGYSQDTAHVIGHENLSKPEIQAAIAKRRAEVADRLHVTQEKIVAEYAKLAFSNTLDYVRVTDEGDAVIDLSALTRDQAAAISELTVEEYMDGRGEDAREVKRIKFKLADKRGALDSLGKHLGMFIERHEHTVTGMSDAERADRLVAILESARKGGTGLAPGERAN